MRNFIVLAVAALFATNAVAAEMKWTGSTGWRYNQTSVNDSLDSKNSTADGKDVSTTKSKSHQMRANLGVMGGWENVEYGFGVRTGAASVNTDYQSLTGNTDISLGIEQAWFRYVRDFGSLELAATVGRQKNALATDSAWQNHFDNDVRFDGFGWNFKFGMFGLNAAQYILGRTTGSSVSGVRTGNAGNSSMSYTEATQSHGLGSQKFATLFAFQPHMTWKFSDEIEAMFAVAYYKWNYEGQTNRSDGGINASTNNTAPATIPAIASGLYRMDNKSAWDVLANVSLPFNLNFVANWVKSKKASVNDQTVLDSAGTAVYAGTQAIGGQPEVSSAAWVMGLTYGKLRKAQDFTVGYAYGSKGLASVIGAFTNDKFAPDNKGHTIVAGYSIADNFNLGFRWMSTEQKDRLNLTGAAAVAGVTYAGTNANQKVKTNYWELTAGVAF